MALMLLPAGGSAQGIGLSLTPSVEETRWGEDLLIPNTVFPGALASAHFGRFVSLDAHYFQSGRQEVTGSATPVEARRWGGDIFVALSPTPIAPFVRLGAGVVEFRPEQEGAEASRHLAASFGGGLRFAVRDRLSGELSVRRLSFRAGPGSGVVEDDGSSDPVRDIGTYTIGAGLRMPLGGTWDNPETDEAVRNLRTLALPVRLFGGSMGFADELGLENHPVMGALLGVDLGPFVGTSLYAFGSAQDGLTSPELFYGYGLESSFNLVRRGAGATPHLILGGGRVHFTEADRATADLDGRKKWTATIGAGLDFTVTDRFRGEAAVRNLVLTQPASADVSSPDQLRSNWLLSAGIRFVVGGGRGRSDTPSQVSSDASGRGGSAGDAPATDDRRRATPDEIEQLELERQRLLGELEVERLRRALDRLRAEDDPSAAERLLAEARREPGEPAAPRTFELPVLEEGEIRVRFGPERGVDSVTTTTGDPAARQDGTDDDADPTEARDPRVASLLERVARLEGRIEELSDRAGQAAAPAVPGNLQVDVQAPGAVGGGAAAGAVSEPAPRGIFRGEGPGFDGAALYAGGRLEPTSQGIMGGEVDIGSALGGSLRVRPGFALGFGSNFIWSLGTDVAWPAPFTLWGLRPGLTAGVGILREDGVTRVMIPNLGVELGHRLTERLEGYMAYQTLDLFDDQRLVVGVRLRPGPEEEEARVRVTVPGRAAEVDSAAGRAPAVGASGQPDSAAVAEREALREELGELGAEVEALRNALSRAEDTARQAERRAEEARAEARTRDQAERDAAEEEEEPDEPDADERAAADPSDSAAAMVEELSALERLESVQDVRRVARGVAVVLGGNRTFGVGEDSLSPMAHSEIGLIAEELLRWDHPISIEGHTDSTGGPELNLSLSEDRAAAVRAALVAHGLAPSAVTSTGFGLTRPVADNATADGRASNRRVEIVVLLDGLR